MLAETEVPLCGHATLASAIALLETGRVLPTHIIHFHTLYVCISRPHT
jgi:predicted PhzF superfamily epimerase YddE/YHI9